MWIQQPNGNLFNLDTQVVIGTNGKQLVRRGAGGVTSLATFPDAATASQALQDLSDGLAGLEQLVDLSQEGMARRKAGPALSGEVTQAAASSKK